MDVYDWIKMSSKKEAIHRAVQRDDQITVFSSQPTMLSKNAMLIYDY